MIQECVREDHFEQIAKLAKKYHIEKVEILPYHELGISKCKRFGLPEQERFHSHPRDFLLRKAKEISEKSKAVTVVR